MKFLLCMASIDPRKGGPSTAIRELSKALEDSGHSVTILAHNDGEHPAGIDGNVIRFPLSSAVWQYSGDYRRWYKEHVREYDFVLITSIFLAHTYFCSREARRAGVPYAIRPHGSLNREDIKIGRWKKAAYIRLLERRSLEDANFIFCTSQAEATQAQQIARLDAKIIPLGVNLDDHVVDRSGAIIDRTRIIFVGRYTRKKGIDILIRAVALLRMQGKPITAVIAGPDDDGLRADYESLAQQVGVADAVLFEGFAGLDRKKALFADACAFVLPSLDENFGIGVAEAMATCVPVIITPGVSHAELVSEYKAGLVTSRTPELLSAAIQELSDLHEDDYREMGRSAARLVREQYSWEKTAQLVVEYAQSAISHNS
ncbi:glycosyltransferase [Rhodococcus koreensis]|uniref:glycosyltransferase n=1 Tax=Rhodococcus koreensis TaxID=99653 RepID=UPI0036719DE3